MFNSCSDFMLCRLTVVTAKAFLCLCVKLLFRNLQKNEVMTTKNIKDHQHYLYQTAKKKNRALISDQAPGK